MSSIENIRQIEGPVSQLPVPVSESAAVLGMIERVARDPSVEMSKMMQLMAWRKETIAEQKRAAFDEAMASAKAEIPVINKNREVDFTSAKGRTHYKYEDLAEISRVVSPILAKFGLSYRYRVTSNVNEPVTVTCIVSHRGGHCEEVTLMGGRDDTGGKNAIQQVASTLTYLQRMTLKAALGLAASDDDDGRTSVNAPEVGSGALSPAELAQIEELIAAAKVNPELFASLFQAKTVAEIPTEKFANAKLKLTKRISDNAKAS